MSRPDRARAVDVAKDLEEENARLCRELADTKVRLEHERAENHYLVTGEEER